jgi:chemotaxis protein CheC
MSQEYNELSTLELDALKEIGNIGSGNAATALAQMLGAKVDMTVPRVSVLDLEDVPELIGGADLPVVGIYLSASGSAPANILFILSIEKACLLIDMLTGKQPGETTVNDLDEIGISALMELGNIITASYLNALSVFTSLDFRPSVPALGMDMAAAILDAILAQFGAVADHILVLETEFKKSGQDIIGHFFLLPEPGSLEVILAALGVNI